MDPTDFLSLSALAWVVCASATALSIVLGALLAYHWFRYAMSPATSLIVFVLYSVISAALLIGLYAASAIL